MIEYIGMDNGNIDDVVRAYTEYYNGAEDGCWTYEKAYKRIHQVMTTEDSLCYLQFDNRKLTGFLMGYYKEYDDLRAYYIDEIVIFSGYHNKGYGTKLIEKVQNEVTANGVTHIELTSVNDEHHTHFYGKLGFHKAGNLVIMAKHF